MTGRMPCRVGSHHGFTVMWSDNVPNNHSGNRWSPALFRSLLAMVLMVTCWPPTAAAQAVIAISSPASGAVVNPGQTMTVTVTSPANVTFTNVGVIGESPIGMSTTLASGLPAQFSFNIPADIACRRYIISADGTTAAGQNVSSMNVVIDVERPDMPTSIRSTLPSIFFESPGGRVPVRIWGSFADGKVLDVSASTNVVYGSSDPTVATVSASGEVTGLTPGDAVVTATYGPPAQGVVVSIPVNVPAPIFSIYPVQLDFGSHSLGSSTPLQMTVTNTRPGALGIVSITATGDYSVTDTCVSASPIAVNATCTITVSFAPTATGLRPGSVAIANSVTMLPVVVRVTGTAHAMKCDANGDGVINQADLIIIRNANGQVASGPDDPRDGNSDGSINVADVRYCQLHQTPP